VAALNILYEDNHVIVVEKPVNMPVQADASGDMDLLSALKAYIKQAYQKPGAVFLGLVHRLDRPVGGVMVFARTSKAAQRLSAAFAGRQVEKRYVAVVDGNPPNCTALEDHLIQDEKGNARAVRPDTPGAKRASLNFTCLARAGKRALLQVELHTGRKHQIRVQLQHAGYPIAGDQRYHPSPKKEQIALFAYSLTFPHPTLKTRMTFQALPSGGAWAAFDAQLKGLPVQHACTPVYCDKDILCVDKRAGFEVVSRSGEADLLSLLEPLYGRLYPVHRLDANTEGLVLFARNQAACEELERAFLDRTIEKTYHCIVSGRMKQRAACLNAYCRKDADRALVHVTAHPQPGAKQMRTAYRVMREQNANGQVYSLLEVELLTGRTHQIRAHLAFEGNPIVGDDKYGDRSVNRAAGQRRQMLLAKRVVLHFASGSPLAHLDGLALESPTELAFPG